MAFSTSSINKWICWINKWISPKPLLFGAILVGNLLLVHLCCPEREREFCRCHQLRQFPADTLVLTCRNSTTVPTPSVHIFMPHSPFPMLFYKMKRLVLFLYYLFSAWLGTVEWVELPQQDCLVSNDYIAPVLSMNIYSSLTLQEAHNPPVCFQKNWAR